jgi:DNA polymerase gamma 1
MCGNEMSQEFKDSKVGATTFEKHVWILFHTIHFTLKRNTVSACALVKVFMFRRNPVGIQMLPQMLHKQIFTKEPDPSPELITLALQHLETHNLRGKTSEDVPPVEIALPKLIGGNLSSHFYHLGIHQSRFYMKQALELCKQTIPPMPNHWERKAGWTQYLADGSRKQIQYPPEEETLVFDTEVMYKLSPFPVIATAVSEKGWYSWCAPSLSDISSSLIPFGNSRRLVIGHHVSFDRARIQEEYDIEKSKIAFLDTLSLHLSVGGLSTQQRNQYLMYKKELQTSDIDSKDIIKQKTMQNRMIQRKKDAVWQNHGTTNSLRAVAEFYLNKSIDKTERDFFATDTMDMFQDERLFQDLMRYCATDVQTTYELFQKIFPKFQSKCPHPVSFAGMLHMCKGYLPTTEKWKHYIKHSEELCQRHQEEIENSLVRICDQVLQKGPLPEDDWLKNLDWDIKPSKMTKEKIVKGVVIPARLYKNANSELVGKPNWYRDLWDSKLKRIRLSLSKNIVPYLLRLEWNGYPLVYYQDYGWLYHTPLEAEVKNAKPLELEGMERNRKYFRIPHPEGEGKNCGNPLSKSYLKAFEKGILTSSIPEAKNLLDLHAKCTYWISARERIMSQMVVWDPKVTRKNGMGVIVPNTIPMGTVTRRATEPTWMTASNAKGNLIGSELKSMIEAPEGYSIVGADVDSQELWIASLLGDAQFKIHGATAIGFMTLQGSKSKGTDLHSVTGQLIGMSRDIAKIFNYSRIYGAGAKYAAELITKHSPEVSQEEAKAKATKLFNHTKGKKIRGEKEYWQGGSESFMFNQLESIARSPDSRTPVLNCQIPDTLSSVMTKNEFMTSRVNWAVQSSGVDYLHLLLVAMEYLMQLFNIPGRFLLSIHDEIRFLVPSKDRYVAALALQISNLWTRAYFASRVGIPDLPLVIQSNIECHIFFCGGH